MKAGSIIASAAPSPLLSSAKPGSCDPKLGQPDYVGGVDVSGNPAAPADMSSAKNPVPNEILVPLSSKGRGDGPVVALDGQALEPLLNPTPACTARPR